MPKDQKLNQFQNVLENVKTRSDELIREADTFPLRTAVTVRIIMARLERINAVPEAFTDPVEREKVYLIWRKLKNIYERCETQLTPDQKSQINPATAAGINLDLVKDVAKKIGPYRQHQQLVQQIENIRSKNGRMSLIQLCAFVIPTFVLGVTAAVVSSNATQSNLMIVFILIYVYFAVVLAGMFIPASKKDKSLPALLKQLDWAEKAGKIKDKDYWQLVTDKLGGIPDNEELLQYAKAQNTVLDSIYHPDESGDITLPAADVAADGDLEFRG